MHTDLIQYVEKNGKQTAGEWENLAKKFGYVSGNAARHIWRRYRKVNKIENKVRTANYIADLEDKVVQFEEDFKNNKGVLTYKGPKEIKTKEQLFAECNVDESKWNLDKMVCNAWGKEGNQNWQIKAWLSNKKDEELFQSNFIEFLETYPSVPHMGFSHEKFTEDSIKPNACLVLNKQDEHLNKFDIGGNNDITDRFRNTFKKVGIILEQAKLSNTLDKIIYIIGSDEFNSEWTATTTKGTPQQNILTHEQSFQLICDYELAMISCLLTYTKNLEVKYIQGNHDEYIGWHLVHFLKSFHRDTEGIIFDISQDCTKVLRYSNTGMMFNHGDAIKPSKLAYMFPQMLKSEWSACDNFYIFTGDKHHERAEDFGGITWYQIPALSTAKSRWDDKNGHFGKAELTAFLIEEDKGRTNIFKQPL